jgi:hypothetical protein
MDYSPLQIGAMAIAATSIMLHVNHSGAILDGWHENA